eukprot:3241283-Pyramimonas_sp.AAC.1
MVEPAPSCRNSVSKLSVVIVVVKRELAAEVFGCLANADDLNVVAVNAVACDGPPLSSGEAAKNFGFVRV